MLQLTETHFEYNNVSSRQYGLMLANVDTSRNLKLIGDVTSSNIFSKKGAKRYFTGDEYMDSPASFEIEIISDSGRCISPCCMRSIEKWLFHEQGYRKLYFDMLDDRFASTYEYVGGELKRTYLMGRFINPERIEDAAGVYGYKAVLETDSLLAWQDPTMVTFDAPEGGFVGDTQSVVHVSVDTDFKDYIYPEVTIKLGTFAGGEMGEGEKTNIDIFNSTDDNTRYTSFQNVANTVGEITLDGGYNFISSDNSAINIYGSFSNKNFIRLLDGDNTISVSGLIASDSDSESGSGNIKQITFKWNNRRWL